MCCRYTTRILFGVNDGDRTHDNRSHRPVLYRLSYIHHSSNKMAPPLRIERSSQGLTVLPHTLCVERNILRIILCYKIIVQHFFHFVCFQFPWCRSVHFKFILYYICFALPMHLILLKLQLIFSVLL